MRTYGPAGFGGTPADWWGFGKLNVEDALLGLSQDVPVATLTLTPSLDTLPQGATTLLRTVARGFDGEQVFVPIVWTSTNPAVAMIEPLGIVRALQPGTTQIIASSDGQADTATIVVTPPATVTIVTASATPDTALLAPAGTRVPLLSVRLEATPGEAVAILALGFDVAGQDPGARLLLIRDRAGDGRIDTDDPVVGAAAASLTAGTQRVRIHPDTVRVRSGEPVHLILAVEVSGAAPHLAAFQATLVPEETRTLGVRSGVRDRFALPGGVIASQPATTTLVQPGQLFSMSENPVRGEQVYFNFRETPTAAAIYTLAGARVTELTRRGEGARIIWDLTNDAGRRVAPGVYLLAAVVGGETVRERLFILTPTATSGQE